MQPATMLSRQMSVPQEAATAGHFVNPSQHTGSNSTLHAAAQQQLPAAVSQPRHLSLQQGAALLHRAHVPVGAGLQRPQAPGQQTAQPAEHLGPAPLPVWVSSPCHLHEMLEPLQPCMRHEAQFILQTCTCRHCCVLFPGAMWRGGQLSCQLRLRIRLEASTWQ
jgi:hypothetical protein